MTSRLNPYLNFRGAAKEAMEFYQSVLGGELTSNTFAEFGMEGDWADGIMHSALETPLGYTLYAADVPPHMQITEGSSITVSISGDDDELRTYFSRLAEGGSVTTALEKQMWGDEFGMLTDRFGVQWMVNIAGSTVAGETEAGATEGA